MRLMTFIKPTPQSNRWSKTEDDILYAMKAARSPNRKIALRLDRTVAAIGERYHRLVQKRGWAVEPTRVRSNAWTAKDDDTLLSMKIARRYNSEIAQQLGRTSEAIDARWKKVRTKNGMPPHPRSREKPRPAKPIIAQAPPSTEPSRAVRHSTLIMDAELRARIAILGPNGLLGDPLPGRSALDRRVIEDPRNEHASRLKQSYPEPGASLHPLFRAAASASKAAPARDADAFSSEASP
jgi:hypothetical protein